MNIKQAIANLFRRTDASFQISYEQINGQIVTSPDNKQSYYDNAFLINNTVSSIINLITDKVKLAQWNVYQVKDEQALGKYKALMSRKDISGQDFKEAMGYRKKALVEVNAGPLNDLIKYPNDYCSFQDLVANSTTFKLITGDRFLWANVLADGANAGKPQSLYLLPSQFINIVVNQVGFPMRPAGYQFMLNAGPATTFPLEQVMHDKYTNPTYSVNGSHLYGLSKLRSALLRIDRSNASNRAALALFQNQGAKGIVFTKAGQKWGSTGADKIKSTLTSREYRGSDAHGKIAFAEGEIGYVPIGMDSVEMQIIQSELWDMRTLCNIFGVPTPLMNDPDNRTFNNQKEAEKALTSRCAIPELNSFRDSFNRMLFTYWGYKNDIMIDYDSTCYTELQEDMAAKWVWVKDLPVDNKYKLDMMGLDYDEATPGLDLVLIPSNYQDIEDLGMNQTTDLLNQFSGNGRANGKPVAAN
jgi:HK97 family phage portal protein